jgi:hypothetical protein
MWMRGIGFAGMTFINALTVAHTRWDAAVLLLETWRTRPQGTPLERHDHDGPFLGHVDEVRAHFDAHPELSDLTDDDRSRILDWTNAGADLQMVDAVGHGLNLAASATFALAWRARIGADTHRLGPGEIYPVADVPWPRDVAAGRRTPAPRSTGYSDDDHPFARAHVQGPFEIEFDLSLWRPLLGIANALDVVATLHPNESLAELGLQENPANAFPARPLDPDAQRATVSELLNRAIQEDARIIVLPELSATPEIIDDLEARLRGDRDRLVVCGSQHEMVDGEPANVALGMVSGRQARLEHRKIYEFGNLFPSDPEKRVREGIVPPDPKLLRIYVADRFRVSLTICMDFLRDEIAGALDRVGANVLLVPAMSRTMQPFRAKASSHVGNAQAVTLVANGPRDWGAGSGDIALLARPYEPDELLPVTADAAPAIALFSVRSGRSFVVDLLSQDS